MEVIIMYSIGLIVISFIIAVTKSKLKGKAGEVTVNHLLKKLNSNEYIIINDFLLHNEGNKKNNSNRSCCYFFIWYIFYRNKEL